jgi:rhodanese-related sulfurtransferase
MSLPLPANASRASLLRQTLLQAGLLVALSGALAWVTETFHIEWRPAPEIREMSAQDALRIRSGVVWVDVRNPERFASAHLPGAVAFDENTHDASLAKVLEHWSPGATVVVYGEGVGSERAERVARRLKRDLKSKGVFLLKGGWAAWPRS